MDKQTNDYGKIFKITIQMDRFADRQINQQEDNEKRNKLIKDDLIHIEQ